MRKYLNFAKLTNSKQFVSNFSSILASKMYSIEREKKKKREREKEITFDAIFLNCNST